MTDEICGHEKGDGEPCEFNPKYPDGKCGHHTDEQEYEGGRPSKLTYERQEAIASDIEAGKSINSAARKQSLDPTTIYNWLDRGESELDGGKDNEFTEFFKRITRARGYGEEKYFNTVWQIAKEEGDHRFLASLMKQRYPDSWAENGDAPGVDTEGGIVINVPEEATRKH